jgi:hypothetical protein
MSYRFFLPFVPVLLMACAASAADSAAEGAEAADAVTAPSGGGEAAGALGAAEGAGVAQRPLADRVGLSAGPCASASCEAARQKFFGLVKDLGIHRIRFDLRWQDVEGTKGKFDFSGNDRVVDEAAAANIDVLGILDYGATWASSHNDQMYPPDHVSDFVDYAKATVSHFDGKISEYEIWNEPNAGFSFWKTQFGGDPKAFGALTESAADAIHGLKLQKPVTVAPGGTVFLSQFVPVFPFGTIPSGPDFMTNAEKASPNLLKSVDAYAFHGYNAYPPRNAPESAALGEVQLGEKITKTKAVAGGHPLWLTEIGWPTANGVDENAQARWSVRAILLAYLAGVDTTYLYTLYDGASPPGWAFSPEGSFGLCNADGSTKQAYRAVKALLSTVGGTIGIKRLAPAGAPGDAYVVELAQPGGKKAWAAWRSDDGQGTWNFTLPTDIKGTIHALDGSTHGATGKTLGVTREPVYVTE